jgi:hypothetical protein
MNCGKYNMKFEKDLGIGEINIIEDFLSPDEITFFIDYIDNNLDIFQTITSHGGVPFKRIMFGKDLYNKDKSESTLEKIKDIEPLLREKIFPKVEKAIKEAYGKEKDFAVCSFFMTKQSRGALVGEHVDTDGGFNMHLEYGGVVYLNNMETGGQLKFPQFNYEYNPEAGNFIFFPSKPYQYRHAVKEINQDRYLLAIWVTEDPLWKL